MNEGEIQLNETSKVLNLNDDPFFKVCVEAYTAASNSNFGTSLESTAESAGGTSAETIADTCRKIQTPDLLATHCSTSTWADIDSNAPWLRALLTIFLASIIPALVGTIVGEGIEALFTRAFPALTNDNAYILFFLNFLINSNVTRYLIFQFSTSSGQSKELDDSIALNSTELSKDDSTAVNSSSIFLVIYLALVELFLRCVKSQHSRPSPSDEGMLFRRNTWKLRKKLVCLFKSEFLGARRKKGETWEEYFESEWNEGGFACYTLPRPRSIRRKFCRS